MNAWFILAFCASALWGLTYVISQYALKFLNPIALFFLTSFLNFVVIGIYMLASHQLPDLWLKLATNFKVLTAVVIYIIVYFIATLLILKSINLGNASLAAMVESAYPLFTIFFAWLILHKVEFNGLMLIGAGLIIVGLILVQIASTKIPTA